MTRHLASETASEIGTGTVDTGASVTRANDRDRGTITPIIIGLTFIVFMAGGLGLDLWRVVSERRAFAEAADASARAGANAIDIVAFDVDGSIVLDSRLAEQFALDNLARQEVSADGNLDRSVVTASADEVTVELDGHVDTTLMSMFGFSRLDFSVESDAAPRLGATPDPD